VRENLAIRYGLLVCRGRNGGRGWECGVGGVGRPERREAEQKERK
jgi:hypothetical protein